MNSKKGLIVFAVLILCFGLCTTRASAAVSSIKNNFTMIAPDGSLFGGTNDVMFTWDGSKKTSVAVSGQVSNATLSSVTPFYGVPWKAHDVAIYAPGTYTVNPCCATGSPGCSDTCFEFINNSQILPITFTVGAGQLGVHILFDWNGNNDIDVVDVWAPNAVFGPSPMYTGPEGGSGNPATVWSYMSSDWNGDGFNGYPMVDGPFFGFNANFNTMDVPSSTDCVPATCIDNIACTNDICVEGICSWQDNCPAGSACNRQTGACMAGTCFNNQNCGDPALYCARATGNCGGVFPLSFLYYRSWEGPGAAIDGFTITIKVGNADSNVHIIDKPMNGQVVAVNVGDTIDVRLAGNPTTGYEWKYASNNSLLLKQTIFTSDPCPPGWTGCGGTYDFIFVPSGDDGGGVGTCQMKPDPNTCPVYFAEPVHACGCDSVTYYDECMAAAAGVNVAFNGNCIACVPNDCNDGDACTLDTCNPSTGCVHTPIICNDGNPCTIDTCDTATGCVHTKVVCNDYNICTTDYCDSAGTGACVYAPKCADTNPCTVDTCDATTGACLHTAINCNDNNACTIDSCNTWNGACVHTPVQCPLGYFCDPATGNCVNQDPCAGVICNDNNTCTTDVCDAATGCRYTPLPDQTACTVNSQPGTCTAGACIVAPVCNGAKSVTIRGGGQKASTVDLQIQTNFTVVNDGCIVASTASTVTCTPGTNLLVDVKAGKGPMPTSCTWKGAPISTDMQLTITCPAVSGDVGKLICDNKLGGGKDSDKMTITVQ